MNKQLKVFDCWCQKSHFETKMLPKSSQIEAKWLQNGGLEGARGGLGGLLGVLWGQKRARDGPKAIFTSKMWASGDHFEAKMKPKVLKNTYKSTQTTTLEKEGSRLHFGQF